MKPSEIRTPAGRGKAATGIATTEPQCSAAARLPDPPQHCNTAPFLPAALAYADRLGLAVLPCAGKSPIIRRGRGVSDATKDPAIIRRWWEKYPFANIGIATGAESGIVIVDVDGDAGRAPHAQLEACYRPLPEAPRQVTGSGGLHLVFAYDPARPIGNRVRCMAGIDTRADGGTSSQAEAAIPIKRPMLYASRFRDATCRHPWRERESQQTAVRAIRAGEQHPRELAQ